MHLLNNFLPYYNLCCLTHFIQSTVKKKNLPYIHFHQLVLCDQIPSDRTTSTILPSIVRIVSKTIMVCLDETMVINLFGEFEILCHEMFCFVWIEKLKSI